jgi:hypothetical protein
LNVYRVKDGVKYSLKYGPFSYNVFLFIEDVHI